MRSESRIWEIRPFGSMRGGSELVIGLCASQSNRSRLLYCSGLLGITRDRKGWRREMVNKTGEVDKGGRQSLRQSWQFWWWIYPPGSWTRYTVTIPANIDASWGPGCYKPVTRCYKPLQLAAFLKP